MDPQLTQELLHQSTITNSYLLWILIAVILLLVIMVGLLVGGYMAFTRLNAKVSEFQESAEKKWEEWEPRIIEMQSKIEDTRSKVDEWMPVVKENVEKGREMIEKVNTFWDDFSPELFGLLEEGKVLFGRARAIMNDIQTTIVPTIRTVTGITNAVRDGLGLFRQVRHNHPVVRR